MSGSISGGKKCAKKNKEQYGEDFYRNIGRKGGSTKTVKLKGFAANPTIARLAGVLGGRNSKRGRRLSEEVREQSKKVNYTRSRVRYYQKKLQTLELDYDIQQAERMLEIWQDKLIEDEQRLKLMKEKYN